MLRAHRQAWAWQDEWVGLTMKDIRALEEDAAEYLSKVGLEFVGGRKKILILFFSPKLWIRLSLGFGGNRLKWS